MERKLLDDHELTAQLNTLNGWTRKGNAITKRTEFDDFAGSLAYVNRVGAIAEEMDHHPDIEFGWGYAVLTITTHDRGGVTDVDIELARRIEAV